MMRSAGMRGQRPRATAEFMGWLSEEETKREALAESVSHGFFVSSPGA
jgi:hypothetical protein